MRIKNVTDKTIAIQKFLADIFIGTGSVVLILMFFSSCMGFNFLPQYGNAALAFFIGVLVYGFGMYTLAIVLESHLEIKEWLDAHVRKHHAAESPQ